MNKIVEILKASFLDEVPTTKDYVYKHKLVSPHNVVKWYETNKDFTKIKDLKYGTSDLYYNPLIEYRIAFVHTQISNKVIKAVQNNNDKEDMPLNAISSEIFNSLWIEGVRSSKKQVKQFAKLDNWNTSINTKLDVYSRNYSQAINFVMTTSTINEQNLYVLYSILTKDIDMGENTLDGFPYRLNDVEIASRDGMAPGLIKPSLDTMFKLIELFSNTKDELLPSDNKASMLGVFLVHYFFELIHPYYDMNGRTGRLLMLWLGKKWNLGEHLLYMSEGINLFKDQFYYQAFKKSIFNDFAFDVTYFVSSMHCALIAQKAVYLMIEEYKKIANEEGKVLNTFEKDVLKNLLSKDEGFYQTRDFILGYDDLNPGQVSTSLSKLVQLGFIEQIESKPKLYKVIIHKQQNKVIKMLEELLKK